MPPLCLATWDPAHVASRHAYEQAGIEDSVEEIDVTEVHDCFSINEIIAYEDLGGLRRAKGDAFIEEGRSAFDGDIAVNPRGGLLDMGHPLGTTGVSQTVEIVNQFRGDVPAKRRMKDPEIGLTHNSAAQPRFTAL